MRFHFINKKIRNYDLEIKKMIIYVNVMLIYVNNIDGFKKKLIYVNFMLIYVNNGEKN